MWVERLDSRVNRVDTWICESGRSQHALDCRLKCGCGTGSIGGNDCGIVDWNDDGAEDVGYRIGGKCGLGEVAIDLDFTDPDISRAVILGGREGAVGCSVVNDGKGGCDAVKRLGVRTRSDRGRGALGESD